MAHLQYSSYPGFGDYVREHTWYSQAVRVGDIIKIAGQGGWDRETRKVEPDSLKQIEAAFDNVQHTLQAAGGEGWKNVYAVRLFHTPVGEKEMGFFVEKLKQYCPDHRPILTGIGVASLAFDMMVEIEVEAHVPQSL